MSVCKNCGSADIDRDTTRGNAVCTQCGVVVEDQIIVSELQFQENASGGASVIGQFVSFEGKHNSVGGSRNYGRDSRHVTLQNGKNRIQKLASNLNMSTHCADMAYNYFKLAVSKGLTKGRRSIHVAAACLYIVCRTEKKPLMLLDFSDKLGTDVYTLGHTYLQLSKELYISIPAIDPSLYIERYAYKLEFAEKTLEVCRTATRLVGRMSRDWMVQGRRPSGICGAALLVAARIFDFNRTVKDIMKVVRIGEQTIKKRLSEFELTPSSKLTVEEFHTINLEETMDPPCFTAGRKKAKLLELEENGELPQLLMEAEELRVQLDGEIQRLINRKNQQYKKYTCTLSTDGDDDDDDADLRELCSQAPSSHELDEELAQYQHLLDDHLKTTSDQLNIDIPYFNEHVVHCKDEHLTKCRGNNDGGGGGGGGSGIGGDDGGGGSGIGGDDGGGGGGGGDLNQGINLNGVRVKVNNRINKDDDYNNDGCNVSITTTIATNVDMPTTIATNVDMPTTIATNVDITTTIATDLDYEVDNLVAAELESILNQATSNNNNNNNNLINNSNNNNNNNNNKISIGKSNGTCVASLGLKESIEECLKKNDDEADGIKNGELDLAGLDDEELDEMILNCDEVRIKTTIWMREHADFLKEMKEKEEKKAKELLENPEPMKKKRKPRKLKPKVEASTAREAIEKILQEKKLSNKINYEVLMDFNIDKIDNKPDVHKFAYLPSSALSVSEKEDVIVLDDNNDDEDHGCCHEPKNKKSKMHQEAIITNEDFKSEPRDEVKGSNLFVDDADDDDFFFDKEEEEPIHYTTNFDNDMENDEYYESD